MLQPTPPAATPPRAPHRAVRDLVPGSVVASIDDPRQWTVTAAGPSHRRGMWTVTMTSPGRAPWTCDYHPDDDAPEPRRPRT